MVAGSETFSEFDRAPGGDHLTQMSRIEKRGRPPAVSLLKSWVLRRTHWPILRSLFNLYEIRRLKPVISHPGLPAFPSRFLAPPPIEPKHFQLAERLLKYWERIALSGLRTGQLAKADLWTEIEARQGELAGICREQDPRRLVDFMLQAPRSPATQGFLQGDREYARLRHSRRYRNFIAHMTADKFISLAEAVGVLPVENPEQGDWGRSGLVDGAVLWAEIETRLGVAATFPAAYGDLFVLDIGGRSVNERDLNAMYTAYRVKQALRGTTPGAVCEIGGGAGRTAYWMHQLAVAPLVIVDLPYVTLIQAWYLVLALGAERIRLWGEEPGDSQQITIYPSIALNQVVEADFALVLNQDSFPEMSEPAVVGYLEWMVDRRSQLLLSMNHESQPGYSAAARHLNVSRMLHDRGGMELLSRSPYWLRRGYTEELIKLPRV